LPIADSSRTRSLAWQVVQTIENNTTRPGSRGKIAGQSHLETRLAAG
jgi:hypothetical protein